MHLLSSLNSGFPAAANGVAQLFIRDTSTRATWYADFEASTSNSSGADIALDAYGSVEVYVNQLVDVVVKDEDGNTVRQFTDGYASPNIEVISPAFTGTDYVTAASAVSEPTTLQAVLDRWETNAGAPDWKVDIEGVATTLENAFGSLTGLVFNVKSPAYGGVGDGTTNDQTAIQAALAAAVAAGGGIVFFPKGTYLITTAIEWSHLVSAVGVGADLSIVTTNSPSNARILTWTTGTLQAMPQVIRGLSFESSQANSGSELYATVAVNLVIESCYFGSSSNATGTLISLTGASSYVQIVRSRFDLNGAANTSLELASTARFNVDGCRFVATNTAWAATMLAVTGRGSVNNSIFDITAVTGAGTRYGVSDSAAGDTVSFTNNKFRQSAQTFTGIMSLVAGSLVTAHGNDYELTATSATSWYTVTGVLRMGSFLQSTGVQSDTGGNATIQNGKELYQQNSNTTVPTTTMPTMLYPGQKLRLMYYNGSAGNWAAITLTSAQLYNNGGAVPTTLAAQGTFVDLTVSDLGTPGTYQWVIIHYHNNSF
jgi:hypothetical protein